MSIVSPLRHSAGSIAECEPTRGQQPVELFVVTDRELQVARADPSLLVVAGSVTRELENLGREVFENGREVDCRARRQRFSRESPGSRWRA